MEIRLTVAAGAVRDDCSSVAMEIRLTVAAAPLPAANTVWSYGRPPTGRRANRLGNYNDHPHPKTGSKPEMTVQLETDFFLQHCWLNQKTKYNISHIVVHKDEHHLTMQHT
jgi:hypothetical protein